jgi:hypothetical protein
LFSRWERPRHPLCSGGSGSGMAGRPASWNAGGDSFQSMPVFEKLSEQDEFLLPMPVSQEAE